VQLPQPSITVDQAVAYPEMLVRQDDGGTNQPGPRQNGTTS
jgi:hypothetical protein